MVKLPDTEFYGCVMFRSFIRPPWLGEAISGVTGECKVVEASEVLGFKPNVRDSNWVVVVQGPKVTMVVPGCEVLNFQAVTVPGSLPLDANPEIVEVP
jgi:hypothetical protein